MGRRFFKPRSTLKKKKRLMQPREFPFLYLNSGGAQKQHYSELMQEQICHCKCTSMADFAYLVMIGKRLSDSCYRECRERNGKISVFYGGIMKGQVVSNYGHMVIAIKQPEEGKGKAKMEIIHNRRPLDSWDDKKTWTMGWQEFHRLAGVFGLQLGPA